MSDVQEVYSILLARDYARELFGDLPHQEKSDSRNWRASCPFCQAGDDGRGHLLYALGKPLWRCTTCSHQGDWIHWLEQSKGMDFQQALAHLAQAAGVELTGPGAKERQAQYQAYTKKASLLEDAQAYFVEQLYGGPPQVGSLVRPFSDEQWLTDGPVQVTDIQEKDGQAYYQTEDSSTYFPESQVLPEGAAEAFPVGDYLSARGYPWQDWEAMELGAYVDRMALKRHLLKLSHSEEDILASGILTKGLGDTHQLTLLWRDAAGRAIGLAARSLLSREELKAKGWPPYLYSKGLQKSQSLVGLETCRGAKQLILVEGLLDEAYLNSLGLKTVALGGTSLSPAQVKALENNRTEELLLALDMDEAGRDATEKAIQTLRQASKLRSYVVSLPAGYKDADELVRARGLQPFQEALEQAEAWPRWMVGRIVSRQDISTDRGMDRALEEGLDFYTSLEPGSREARDAWTLLRASLGLSEEELSQKAEDKAHRASQRRSQSLLASVLPQIEQKAAQGDILGAEQQLSEALQSLRATRGVRPPEPYLLADLERDVLLSRPGLKTGWSRLDELLTIPQGAITIVAGRPGHGKTTLMLNMLLQQVRKYQERHFALFSYEEAQKFLALKLIMLMAGQVLSQEFNLEAYINYFQEKRGTNKAIEQAIQEYEQLTDSGRLLLSDSMPAGEDLATTIAWLHQRQEIGAIYVDYIQKIPLRRGLQVRYLEIKAISALLLEQAVQCDIPIILGAQLGRAKERGSKVSLDNLREGGDIEQDSSLVIGLYNESVDKMEDSGEADKAREVELKLSILKQRTGLAGRSCSLTFDRPILRIQDKSSSSSSPWA